MLILNEFGTYGKLIIIFLNFTVKILVWFVCHASYPGVLQETSVLWNMQKKNKLIILRLQMHITLVQTQKAQQKSTRHVMFSYKKTITEQVFYWRN